MSSGDPVAPSPPAPASAPAGAPALTGQLWKASSISDPFTAANRAEIESRRAAGRRVPRLVGILATRSAPSIAYAQFTQRACEAVGIQFEIWRTWDDASLDPASEGPPAPEQADPWVQQSLEADVEDLVIAANADPAVDGIMVYYPIFGGRRDTYLQQIVDPRKDVEGLHFSYCWNMYHNVRWLRPEDVGKAPGTATEVALSSPSQSSSSSSDQNLGGDRPPPGFFKSILPCTPLAVVKCLEAMGVYDRSLAYGDRLKGKVVTIVNRSEVVGRPLAALLANDGATVYSVDLDGVLVFSKEPHGAGTDGEEATSGARPANHPPGATDAVGSRNLAASQRVKEARKQNALRRVRAHHQVRSPASGEQLTLQDAVTRSDVVIGGVPSASFTIPTEWIRPGATCVNFSSEKNFNKDCRSRAAQYLPAIGKLTIAMLQRNLLRLVEYAEAREQKQQQL